MSKRGLEMPVACSSCLLSSLQLVLLSWCVCAAYPFRPIPDLDVTPRITVLMSGKEGHAQSFTTHTSDKGFHSMDLSRTEEVKYSRNRPHTISEFDNIRGNKDQNQLKGVVVCPCYLHSFIISFFPVAPLAIAPYLALPLNQQLVLLLPTDPS